MKILVVCRRGVSRGKFLADHLRLLGYETDFAGIGENAVVPLSQNKIDWAEVIMCVRGQFKASLLDHFSISKGKKVISLEVSNDRTKYSPEAQSVSEDEFRKNHVNPLLIEQLEHQIQHLYEDNKSGNVTHVKQEKPLSQILAEQAKRVRIQKKELAKIKEEEAKFTEENEKEFYDDKLLEQEMDKAKELDMQRAKDS